jgi:hypothetical protein
MLSKVVIFLVAFIGIFALIITGLQNVAINMSTSLSATSPNSEMEIRNRFKASDLFVYNSVNANTIYFGPGNSIFIDLTGFPDEHLEIWWAAILGVEKPLFEVRHTKPGAFGWWIEGHELTWKHIDGTTANFYSVSQGRFMYGIVKDTAESDWNSTAFASPFYVSCDHYSSSILLIPYHTDETIGQSWDLGRMNYTISYSFNTNSTGLNAFTILSMIVGFTNPDIGTGGFFGTMINGAIALALWGARIYLIYKIIMGIIPFVSGGSGD